MGVAKDLRKALFGGFMAWMQKKKFRRLGMLGFAEDPFSMDIYMLKAFDVLYREYEKDVDKENLRRNIITNFDAQALREMTAERLAIETKTKEAEERKKGVTAPPPAEKVEAKDEAEDEPSEKELDQDGPDEPEEEKPKIVEQ